MIIISVMSSGAPPGKKLILFVDDLNMPKLDTYGSQPPIELLRQYQVLWYTMTYCINWCDFHVCFL